MSQDKMLVDYSLLKRHYDCDDYISLVVNGVTFLNGIPFTANQDYYVVGLMAYLHDPTLIDIYRGWTQYTHGEAQAPTFLQPFLATLGVSTWPAVVPAFEAKDILFYATEDCWVQFEDGSRVRHFIPKEDYIRFRRRCFKFHVTRSTINGVLRAYIEG